MVIVQLDNPPKGYSKYAEYRRIRLDDKFLDHNGRCQHAEPIYVDQLRLVLRPKCDLIDIGLLDVGDQFLFLESSRICTVVKASEYTEFPSNIIFSDGDSFGACDTTTQVYAYKKNNPKDGRVPISSLKPNTHFVFDENSTVVFTVRSIEHTPLPSENVDDFIVYSRDSTLGLAKKTTLVYPV